MTLGSKIQVFVIDDHPMIRKGLQSEIENDLTLKFIGSASSIKDALPIIGFKAVDVLVVDISLKDENGLLEFTNIRKKQPNLKIIFFTIHRDWEYLQKAAMLGADGYLLKSDSADRILGAIKDVFKGKKIFPEEVAQYLPNFEVSKTLAKNLSTLTKREKEILNHIMEGKLNREIAEILDLSVRTVETHRASILQKLDVKSSIELAKVMLELRSDKY